MAKWEFGHQIGGSALFSNGLEPVLYVTQVGGEIHKLNLMDPQKMPQKLETIYPVRDLNASPEIVGIRDSVAVASEDSLALLQNDKLRWKIHVSTLLFFYWPNKPIGYSLSYCIL